ncbi:MAG: 30S ribosomal protein S16 [Patescibacteria group bacterium]|jgi:small subunit ribosomal protein S16
MLTIRFSRKGKKKAPLYSIIVVEKAKDPWGDYTDKLGTYNPQTKVAVIDGEKAKDWIAKGAQPSETVHNLFVTQGIIKAEKVRASKSKPGKKKRLQVEADKKAKDAEDAAKAKAEVEAKAQAEKEAEEAKVATETPKVEEVKAEEAPAETKSEEPIAEEKVAE